MFFVGVLTSLMRHLILSRMFITDWWVKTKVKENGHEKAYAPNGALRIKLWDGLYEQALRLSHSFILTPVGAEAFP